MENFLTRLDLIIPTGLVIVILVIVLWVLYYQNKEIYKKLLLEKNKIASYKKSLQQLSENASPDPKNDLRELNRIARNFFKEYLNLDHNLTYLELSVYFKNQNKQNFAVFCEMMNNLQYSGEAITRNSIIQLISILYKTFDYY